MAVTQTATPPDDLGDALPVGSPIGGYKVVRVLGQGGFGITYAADNRVTGRSVAIKEFFPASLVRRGGASKLVYPKINSETIDWALRKFEETTTTLCKLSHANIVQVLNYVQANDTGYMIMELVQGQTLKDWLKARQRAPTLDELRPLLFPVMDALAYVHGQGLVHRDIAPDNILITSDGRPVLIDFGSMSADLSRAGQAQASSTVGLTKRYYTAPEQMSARTRPGPTADIYSLGAVVYRALCGTEPMDGQDRIDAMFLRKEADPYRAMAGMRPVVCPPHAAALVDRSLEMRPENRPRAVADLRDGLFSPPTIVVDRPGAEGTKGNARTMQWMAVALAIVAVAIVVGLLGYKWLDDSNRREMARINSSQPSQVPDTSQPVSPPASTTSPPPEPLAPPPAAPTAAPTAAPPDPRSLQPPVAPPVSDPEPAPETTEAQGTSCTVGGLDPNGNNWLALRMRPSFQSTWSSTRMGPGTVVTSFGRSGDWRHVRLASGEIGWANGRFLSCGAAAPPPQAASTSSGCTVGGLDPNGNNWLALRTRPSFQSTWSSTRMGPGTHLTVTGKTGDWLHVRLASGETGWANGRFVSCGGGD